MLVLSFFDCTGNMVRPWAENGYDCLCLDLKHRVMREERVRGGKIVYAPWNALNRPWDALNYRLPWSRSVKGGYGDAIFASFFPPCTHLAISGSRWMKGKGLRALAESIELFAVATEIAESLECPYLIENPMSTISTYWREPDHKFQPCDYGDPYTKETWLWVGGGFRMPPKILPGDMFDEPTWVPPDAGSKMHLLPPSEYRAAKRAETPMGFARAAFEANKPDVVAA